MRITLAIIFCTLLAVVLGCSESGDSTVEAEKKSIPESYLGLWKADDGSTVAIRADGTGDYKFGGKTVSGGSVEVDEAAKEIRFSFLGFDAGKYKIDQAPTGNKMKLDGSVYRRSSGRDNEKETAVTDRLSVPLEKDLRELIYESLAGFGEAVRQGDFSDFSAASAKKLQDQAPPAKLKEIFSDSVRKRLDFSPRDERSLEFDPKPFIEGEKYLNVTVRYENGAGDKPTVQLDYVQEDGEWKLAGLRLNPDAKGR